jgi:hypothetical protein
MASSESGSLGDRPGDGIALAQGLDTRGGSGSNVNMEAIILAFKVPLWSRQEAVVKAWLSSQQTARSTTGLPYAAPDEVLR